MPDNLLAQAIADARQVRDMAYAEARNKLEEAFMPHLASKLSTSLREDNDNTSGIGSGLTVDEPAPKKPSPATSASSHIVNPGLETDTFGEGSTEKKPLKEGEEEFGADEPVSTEPAAPAAPALPTPAPVAATTPTGAPTGTPMGDPLAQPGFDGGAGAPDELDLEAIIRELELDSQGAGNVPGAGAGVGAPAAAPITQPAVESFQDPMAGAKPLGALDGALKETLAGKPGDGTFHDGKSPTPVDGVNGGKKVSAGQAVTGSKEERMMEEFQLDEILKELEETESAAVTESQRLSEENTKLKNDNRELREGVQFLRKTIQEVNVLNAQLMYTNKLFRNFDLKLEQKKHIVESFDRAQSVREVKIVYTTLAESLIGKLNATRKSAAKPITEGMASKPVGSTAPKSDPAILTEGTTQVARWQKIAGIKVK